MEDSAQMIEDEAYNILFEQDRVWASNFQRQVKEKQNLRISEGTKEDINFLTSLKSIKRVMQKIVYNFESFTQISGQELFSFVNLVDPTNRRNAAYFNSVNDI